MSPSIERNFGTRERESLTGICPSEQLLYPDSPDSIWPSEILQNEKLRSQAEMRRELNSSLESIYSKIPDPAQDIAEALRNGQIEPSEVAALFNRFSDFLENDPANARALLYFPFELIPDKSEQDGQSASQPDTMAESSERLRSTYLKTWRELLSHRELRANFVDGDILEAELRTDTQPQVVKAAHLLPALVVKKLITTADAIKLMEESDDSILKESLSDAMPVLADLNLINADSLSAMLNSTDPLVRNTGVIIRNNMAHATGTSATDRLSISESTDAAADPTAWIAAQKDQLGLELTELAAVYESRKSAVPEPRAAWERKRDEAIAISNHADEIATAILENVITANTVRERINHSESDRETILYIESVRKAAEALAAEDIEQSRTLCATVDETMRMLWENASTNDAVKDAIESMWLRWAKLDIIDSRIERADLAKDLANIADISESFVGDPGLSQYLYPASIVYGSKTKGYGTRTGDTDMAIMVRPGAPETAKERIRSLIAEKFADVNIGRGVLEFWIDEQTGDSIEGAKTVHDFADNDSHIADSNMAHTLFNGIWCGSSETIHEMHKTLLPGYLYSKGKTIKGHDARSVWLHEMERDTLQYRLMHKGYHRSHPERGGLDTAHSSSVDSQSAFWDSGYRRLATSLFIKKVFLPQLERGE